MIDAIKNAVKRWLRARKQASIARQLDDTYANLRLYRDKEQMLLRQHRELSAAEVQSRLPTRRARGW
jgi:hypothetical protein